MTTLSETRLHLLTLTTCHNRRDCTLAALADLHAQSLLAGISLHHCIVDDGSTDGTADAVRADFPGVTVLEGDGTLFWAGGMRFGWEQYGRHEAFDYLFVYNDDARFDTTALSELLNVAEGQVGSFVVVGSFLDIDGKRTTYGARRRSSHWHPFKFGQIVEPNGTVQEADTLNMNGALISRGALETVGFLSKFFVHSNADFEYGLKLRKAGGRVLVAPRHIGRCAMNPASLTSPLDAPSLPAALKMLFDPKREPFLQRLGLYRRHGGWFWPVLWIVPYLTIWLQPLRRRRRRRRIHNEHES